MFRTLTVVISFILAAVARGQIQVDLKFSRFQYIAYEPVLAQVTITNLAGRAVELRDDRDQTWYGFEVTTNGGRMLAPIRRRNEPALRIGAGESVTRKIDLAPLFPISDLGAYHVRANVFFADLNKFFYARTKVFEVTSARPIWERTVGDPEGNGVRTYSLMTNRFPDHTSLYVRVEDKANNLIYATYSLGRVISFDEPQAEVDRENRLHVLQSSGPRLWAYSVVNLEGRLLQHAAYSQARAIPRLHRTPEGVVTVKGGILNPAARPSGTGKAAPESSARAPESPPED